jgi:hypothetical protein
MSILQASYDATFKTIQVIFYIFVIDDHKTCYCEFLNVVMIVPQKM